MGETSEGRSTVPAVPGCRPIQPATCQWLYCLIIWKAMLVQSKPASGCVVVGGERLAGQVGVLAAAGGLA